MRTRGFILVMALWLVLLLFVMGMAFLGSSAGRNRAAASAELSAQAYWVARAGLDDALTKLATNLRFPPRGADDQTVFSWSEDLTDASGAVMGSYTVMVDQTWTVAPYRVARITSVGRAGQRDAPMAQRVLRADLDLAQDVRGSPGTPNPDLFRLLDLRDSGSL
ncbi:MAG: hypothetical protein AB1758_08525 [Candidatus Eremiobacterota bacterium]